MRKSIAIFARSPVPGQVKTRLAQHVGDQVAARLYAAMLRDTIALATQCAQRLEPCETVIAYTPRDAFEAGEYSLSQFWNRSRLAQCKGDLGARMLDCIARLQEQGSAQVVLLGSDIPDLPAEYVEQAFAALSTHDVVFGPTRDGGFYLIGAAAPLDAILFQGVEWSTSKTLAQVLPNVERLNLRSHLLPSWEDVDTMDDMKSLATRLQQQRSQAPATARCIALENLL